MVRFHEWIPNSRSLLIRGIRPGLQKREIPMLDMLRHSMIHNHLGRAVGSRPA